MSDEKESTTLMEAGTEHGKERTGLQRMYWTHIRQHACEFVTAMILLFNTCSASYLASGISEQNVTISTEPALPIEGAFVAGFTVFSLLTMFFYVSVAHISPTVTFGFALGGSFDWKLMPSYIVCQVLGGVVGAMLAQVFTGFKTYVFNRFTLVHGGQREGGWRRRTRARHAYWRFGEVVS